jgi:hypothetical protein
MARALQARGVMRIMTIVAPVLLAAACGPSASTSPPAGSTSPPSVPGRCQIAAPLPPIAFPAQPACLLVTDVGLTGGTLQASLGNGSFFGDTTDARFSQFNLQLGWTEGGACGAGGAPTHTITIVIDDLRYRAGYDIVNAPMCVAKSRIDFSDMRFNVTPGATLAINAWITAFKAMGPAQAILPALDASLLPVSQQARTTCPITSPPAGSGTRCSGWTELPSTP